MSEKVTLDVAVGIVFNLNHQILIAKRPAYQALKRELHEEVNLMVIDAQPWRKIAHTYQTMSVLLDIWTVSSYRGQIKAMEGQEIRWVDIQTLAHYEFAPANKQIIDALMNGAHQLYVKL